MGWQHRPARPTQAELLAVLSLATGLSMGQPVEHVPRRCLIAVRLAGWPGRPGGLAWPAPSPGMTSGPAAPGTEEIKYVAQRRHANPGRLVSAVSSGDRKLPAPMP